MKLEVNAHRLGFVRLVPQRHYTLELWECEGCGVQKHWRQGILLNPDDREEKRYREEGLAYLPWCPATGARSIPAAVGTGWKLLADDFLGDPT